MNALDKEKLAYRNFLIVASLRSFGAVDGLLKHTHFVVHGDCIEVPKEALRYTKRYTILKA